VCEQIIAANQFLAMAQKAKALATVDAAERVAQECLQLGDIHHSTETG
jgi:UDP-N-acetylglucosamine:LPS N-acetylglucosamine transferase